MNSLTRLVMVPATVLVLSSCSAGEGRPVEITMSNYDFAPKPVEVAPGERILWVINNPTDLDHEFESDEGGFLEIIVPPGASRRVGWTAPEKPGDYTFICDMPGHEGMEMTVRVTETQTAQGST